MSLIDSIYTFVSYAWVWCGHVLNIKQYKMGIYKNDYVREDIQIRMYNQIRRYELSDYIFWEVHSKVFVQIGRQINSPIRRHLRNEFNG
jgi:hypothetical protein